MSRKLTDDRLKQLLKCVSEVDGRKIPPNTPCFWDERDRVAATYTDLQDVIKELLQLRGAS